MATYRCSLCGISYPAESNFRACPIHQELNRYWPMSMPDENWEWQATLIAKRLEVTKAEETPPRVRVPITTDEDGRDWLNVGDLVRVGLKHPLHLSDVVEVVAENGEATLYEVQGRDNESRRYWVRPMALDPVEIL